MIKRIKAHESQKSAHESQKSAHEFQKTLIKASKKTGLFIKWGFRKNSITFTAYILNVYLDGLKKHQSFNREYFEMLQRNTKVQHNYTGGNQ